MTLLLVLEIHHMVFMARLDLMIFFYNLTKGDYKCIFLCFSFHLIAIFLKERDMNILDMVFI